MTDQYRCSKCKHWSEAEVLKYRSPMVKMCPVKRFPVIHLNFCRDWEAKK